MSRQLLLKVAQAYIQEGEQTDLPAYFRRYADQGTKPEQAGGYLDSSLTAALRILDAVGESGEAGDPDPREMRARALFQKGRIWLSLDKAQEATTRFRESIEVLPTPEAYYNVAICLDKLTPTPFFGNRNTSPIIDAYMKVIELDPNGTIAVDAARKIFQLGGLDRLLQL